jgi:hypothetical protein
MLPSPGAEGRGGGDAGQDGRRPGSVTAGLPRNCCPCWELAGLVFIGPSKGTLRRVLIALDGRCRGQHVADGGGMARAAGGAMRPHRENDDNAPTLASR